MVSKEFFGGGLPKKWRRFLFRRLFPLSLGGLLFSKAASVSRDEAIIAPADGPVKFAFSFGPANAALPGVLPRHPLAHERKRLTSLLKRLRRKTRKEEAG